jgi:F-type H+-transporting ATPase subunit delta
VIERLARRYARALLDLARAAGTLEATGEELRSASATFEEPRLRAIALTPAIDLGARERIVAEVVGALAVSNLVKNLLLLLARRDRLRIVPDVARAYAAMVDEALDRARVTIRSATTLTPAERTELTQLARRLTGRREVLVDTEVDTELLGGVVLDAGGRVYDGSIRTQLQRFGREMAERGI